MNVIATPKTKTRDLRSGKKATTQENNLAEEMYQRGLFLSMALNMTWQLAIVVIVPIVGGHELDRHFHTSPWWTIAGFGVAVAGVIRILIKVVIDADRRAGNGAPKNGSKK